MELCKIDKKLFGNKLFDREIFKNIKSLRKFTNIHGQTSYRDSAENFVIQFPWTNLLALLCFEETSRAPCHFCDQFNLPELLLNLQQRFRTFCHYGPAVTD